MTVRRTTIGIIVLTVLGLAITTFAATRVLVHDGFSTLEREYAARDVDRVRNDLRHDIDEIDTTAADWASWDETYNYAGGTNPAYAVTNLSGDTLPQLGLNLFVIIGTDGRTIVARSVDRKSGAAAPIPGGLAAALGPHANAPGVPGERAFSGIAALESGPLLFSARPVLTTNGDGPARGLVVMGRYLDAETIAEIEQETLLTFDVVPDYTAGAGSVTVSPESEWSLLASAPLETVGTGGTYGIRLHLNRGIYKQGQHVTRWLLAAVLSIAVVFAIVIFLLLEGVVVRRLSALGRALTAVGEHGHLGGRVAVQGRDEIARLATDVNSMLASLEESEARCRGLVDGALEGIFLFESGRIALANPAALELVGAPLEELAMVRFDTLLDAGSRAAFEQAFASAAENRSTGHLSAELRPLAGEPRQVELSVAPTAYSGQPRVQVVARDVTERLAAARRRLEMEEKIRETQRLESLGVLAGGIAHDFNNLLMAVLGNASLARMSIVPGSPADEAVEEVEAAAVRAADLTRQLLAYAGGGKMLVERLDLPALVEETARLVRRVTGGRANLTVETSGELPSVEGDETQLRQIVMNLLTNASDALDAGQGEIVARTGVTNLSAEELSRAIGGDSARPGLYVWVEVADTGTGIPAADLARIFDPFYSTKGTGRGLGLAAVLGIVKSHGGALFVDSDTARGTTMRVLLPAAGPPLRRTAAVVPVKAESCHGAALVVDDDASVLRATQAMLQRIGFETVPAADASLALRELERGTFDIVVMDLTMPGMSGLEALRVIRPDYPALPVILVSGHSAETAGVDVASDHHARFLQKPFDLSTLAHAAEGLLGGTAPLPSGS